MRTAFLIPRVHRREMSTGCSRICVLDRVVQPLCNTHGKGAMTAADQLVAWGILGAIGMFFLCLIALVSYGLIRDAAMRRKERAR